jgi:hypothetical protein
MEEAGAIQCKFPDGPFEETAKLTILMEAASYFEQLLHSGDCNKLTDPLGRINGYASEQFSASDFCMCSGFGSYCSDSLTKYLQLVQRACIGSAADCCTTSACARP